MVRIVCSAVTKTRKKCSNFPRRIAGGSVAAALVEAQTFAYVYSATEKRQMHGDSALIDLQSEKEVTEVLGAVLITAVGGSGSQLLVLTSDELQEFRIR